MNSSETQNKNILFISELPDNTKQIELEGFFYDYKSDIHLMQLDSNLKVYDYFNTKKPKATIIFKTHEKAAEARNNLNMRRLKGKALNIMWHERDNSIRYNNKANIFVKGFSPKAEPRQIYELFAKYGEIISCKICENDDGDLLGYGYINYYNLESAEEAIKNLNNSKFMGDVLEVTHFKKKNERLQATMENCSIYIKNIPKAYLDIEKLKTLFSKYGTITFAQLYKDKGRHFAILAFADSENAKKAKEEMNNKKLSEKDELPLYVDMLQKKSERKRMLITKIVDNNNKLNQETKNCNLYIKNLPLTLKEEAKMKEIFSKIGPVKSVKIDKYILQTKRGDKDLDILSSSGFGYVCYNNEEDAKKAIEEFNNKKLPGYESSPRPVLISFFQPKSERKQVISKMLGQQNMAPIPMSPYPYPFMIPIPRPMMNRNNYKNTYHKPQQRSQQQNINANRPKVNQETDNRDSFGTSSINKEDEPNYEHMKSLANEELQKDYLGEFLFKKIEQHPLAQSKNLDVDTISRITGMILGIGNLDEIYEITTKNEYIEGRIKEALALLGIK